MKTQYQVLRAPIDLNAEGAAIEVGIYDSEDEAKTVIQEESQKEDFRDWRLYIHELTEH